MLPPDESSARTVCGREVRSNPPRTTITRRAVALGAALTVAHTVWLVYEEITLAHIGTPSIFTIVKTVIGILFVLMALNLWLRSRWPALMLQPAELMVIFVMTTFGSILTSVKLLHYLFPTVLWPIQYPHQAGGTETAVAMSPIMAPRDEAVVRAFFNGTGSLWGFFQPAILRHWLVPMLFWACFFFMLLWTTLCLASLVRRPWIDHERLPFPIVDLPVTMASQGVLDRLMADRLLVIGFVITVALLSLNYVSSMVPSVPGIRLSEYDVGSAFFTSSPWSALNPLLTVWWPFAIGLCYLIPLDVSFSSWFFFLAIRLLTVLVTAMGWRDAGSVQDSGQFPYMTNAVEGGWIGMFLVILWSARPFLRELFRAIRQGERIPGDESEALPYRHALVGAAVGYMSLVAASVALGMRLRVAVTAFALFFIAVVVMTRIYAQIAMPLFCMAFYSFTDWTTHFFGPARMSRTELATLTSFHWFDRTYEQLPMGHQLEAFVFADRLRESKRRMLRIVLGTSVLSIALGMVTLLTIFYDRGATSARLSGDSAWLAGYAWLRFTSWLGSPAAFDAAPLLRGGLSACFVLFLGFLRSVWVGCPLHPIGYLLTVSFALEWGMWNVIFVTWLIKALVVRYGGLRLYRKTVPFFLGLVLGDCVAHFIWGVGLTLAGVTGASPY